MHVICANMPRSGHHLFERIVRETLQDEYRYCEFEQAPGCCKQVPCSKHAEFARSPRRVFMQKNHDFRFECPQDAGADVRYVVQVRHPVPRLHSYFALRLRSETVTDTVEEFDFFLAKEAAYNVMFLDKWPPMTGAGHPLLRYEDLAADAPAQLARVFSSWGITPAGNSLADAIAKCMPYRDMGGSWYERPETGSRWADPARMQLFEEFIFSRIPPGPYQPLHTNEHTDETLRRNFLNLAEAHLLMLRKDHAGALAAVERIPPAMRGERVELLRTKLGRWETIREHKEAAFARIEEIARAPTPDAAARAQALYEYSRKLLNEASPNYAAHAARAAVTLAPDNAELSLHAARLCVQQGWYGAAVLLCKSVVKYAPDQPENWYYAATVMEHQARLPDALAFAMNALEMRPGNADYRALLKRVYESAQTRVAKEKNRDALVRAEQLLRAGG